MPTSTEDRLGTLHDLFFVREQLPIEEVARKLKLKFRGKMIHCWHPERHAHGDRTPSVSIDRKTNRIKCFGCASGLMSCIDLVQDVRRCSNQEAIRWIIRHFEVRKLKELRLGADPGRGFESTQDLLNALVESGLWADLSLAAKALTPALVSFGEREGKRLVAGISYKALQRYSGLSSRSVRKGLLELEERNLIAARPSSRRVDGLPLKESGRYDILCDSKEFRQRLQERYLKLRTEIDTERVLSVEARADRARILTSGGRRQ